MDYDAVMLENPCTSHAFPVVYLWQPACLVPALLTYASTVMWVRCHFCWVEFAGGNVAAVKEFSQDARLFRFQLPLHSYSF